MIRGNGEELMKRLVVLSVVACAMTLFGETDRRAFTARLQTEIDAASAKGGGLGFFDHDTVQFGRFWAKPPVSRPRMVVFMNCRGNLLFERCRIKTDFPCPVRSTHVNGLRLDDVSVEADER